MSYIPSVITWLFLIIMAFTAKGNNDNSMFLSKNDFKRNYIKFSKWYWRNMFSIFIATIALCIISIIALVFLQEIKMNTIRRLLCRYLHIHYNAYGTRIAHTDGTYIESFVCGVCKTKVIVQVYDK